MNPWNCRPVKSEAFQGFFLRLTEQFFTTTIMGFIISNFEGIFVQWKTITQLCWWLCNFDKKIPLSNDVIDEHGTITWCVNCLFVWWNFMKILLSILKSYWWSFKRKWVCWKEINETIILIVPFVLQWRFSYLCICSNVSC